MARGSDRGGRTKASATTEFRLENAAENRTAVIVDATFVVSGGLAPFAQTGGVHLVRSMMADFSENLSKLIAEDSADAGPPARTKLRGGRLGFTVLWGVIKEAFAKLVRGRRARATTSEEQHAGRWRGRPATGGRWCGGRVGSAGRAQHGGRRAPGRARRAGVPGATRGDRQGDGGRVCPGDWEGGDLFHDGRAG